MKNSFIAIFTVIFLAIIIFNIELPVSAQCIGPTFCNGACNVPSNSCSCVAQQCYGDPVQIPSSEPVTINPCNGGLCFRDPDSGEKINCNGCFMQNCTQSTRQFECPEHLKPCVNVCDGTTPPPPPNPGGGSGCGACQCEPAPGFTQSIPNPACPGGTAYCQPPCSGGVGVVGPPPGSCCFDNLDQRVDPLELPLYPQDVVPPSGIPLSASSLNFSDPRYDGAYATGSTINFSTRFIPRSDWTDVTVNVRVVSPSGNTSYISTIGNTGPWYGGDDGCETKDFGNCAIIKRCTGLAQTVGGALTLSEPGIWYYATEGTPGSCNESGYILALQPSVTINGNLQISNSTSPSSCSAVNMSPSDVFTSTYTAELRNATPGLNKSSNININSSGNDFVWSNVSPTNNYQITTNLISSQIGKYLRIKCINGSVVPPSVNQAYSPYNVAESPTVQNLNIVYELRDARGWFSTVNADIYASGQIKNTYPTSETPQTYQYFMSQLPGTNSTSSLVLSGGNQSVNLLPNPSNPNPGIAASGHFIKASYDSSNREDSLLWPSTLDLTLTGYSGSSVNSVGTSGANLQNIRTDVPNQISLTNLNNVFNAVSSSTSSVGISFASGQSGTAVIYVIGAGTLNLRGRMPFSSTNRLVFVLPESINLVVENSNDRGPSGTYPLTADSIDDISAIFVVGGTIRTDTNGVSLDKPLKINGALLSKGGIRFLGSITGGNVQPNVLLRANPRYIYDLTRNAFSSTTGFDTLGIFKTLVFEIDSLSQASYSLSQVQSFPLISPKYNPPIVPNPGAGGTENTGGLPGGPVIGPPSLTLIE